MGDITKSHAKKCVRAQKVVRKNVNLFCYFINNVHYYGKKGRTPIASLGKLANNSKKAAKSIKSYLRSEKALHKHGESQDPKNNNQNSKYGRARKNNLNLKTKNK